MLARPYIEALLKSPDLADEWAGFVPGSHRGLAPVPTPWFLGRIRRNKWSVIDNESAEKGAVNAPLTVKAEMSPHVLAFNMKQAINVLGSDKIIDALQSG